MEKCPEARKKYKLKDSNPEVEIKRLEQKKTKEESKNKSLYILCTSFTKSQPDSYQSWC
jgi:hypothetical protein